VPTLELSLSETTYTPIPALLVGLRAPDSGRSQSLLPAIVDTGADMTLVPLSMLEQISAPELDEVRLRRHWGETTTATTYLIDMELGADILPGVEVVGDLYGETVLLGRNVINKLLLLIDGPGLSTDLLTRRPPTT
jgi:predicted aspartyl protease